ncbi:MAG: HlyD family efflux transporter periplasmic adaptor subunit [Candidatus Nanopelagicales bacterium]
MTQIADRTPVTTRALVIALAGISLLVIGAMAWAVLGRAPDTVEGRGVILPREGYAEIGTTTEGVVEQVSVGPGAQVIPGSVVAVVETVDGQKVPVTSTLAGQIVDVFARPGRRTALGQPMAIVEPSTGGLVVKAFLPAARAEAVSPGMQALVSPAGAPQSQFGYVEGTVASVAPAAASQERLLTLLGDNQTLVDFVLSDGPVQEVTVELTPAATPSGFEWTIGSGPAKPITASAVADVIVVLRENSVASWVFR